MSVNIYTKIIALVAVVLGFASSKVAADQKIQDDLIVVGSICVGFDCNTGETFNFDTLRLKENNLRIKFTDTSSSSSFPTIDWEMVINDSVNGGLNKFSIAEIDSGNTPFTILQSAPNHSIFVTANGNVGMGTSTPLVELHIQDGNSPSLRLHQDGTGGFAEQIWDVSGNETNFFIRDVSNNGNLPLRISPGAPNSSIHVAADGDIGFETSTPDGILDIAHPGNSNNHALLLAPSADFGVNIDNGFVPNGLFDVQTTGGQSRFMVRSDGNVGIGMGTSSVPAGIFEVKIGGVSKFIVDADGDLGAGAATPNAVFHVNRQTGKSSFVIDSDDTPGTTHLIVNESGQVAIGTNNPIGAYALVTQFEVFSNTEVTQSIRTASAFHPGNLVFSANGADQWLMSSRNFFADGGVATLNRLAFYNGSKNEVLTVHQNASVVIGTKAGNDNSTSHAIEAANANNAHLTTGGVWTDASSREFKNDIVEISVDEAKAAVEALNPVTFNYKVQPDETYAGFIAEDVPEIVATNDRTSLAPMDIIAVLTKVVQDQQKTIEKLEKRLDNMEAADK